jgi:hypothetical protein
VRHTLVARQCSRTADERKDGISATIQCYFERVNRGAAARQDRTPIPRASLWARWKGVAHRAAILQGQALFFIVYLIVIVPMGLVGIALSKLQRRTGDDVPRWHDHDNGPVDLNASRRQF